MAGGQGVGGGGEKVVHIELNHSAKTGEIGTNYYRVWDIVQVQQNKRLTG